MNYREFYQNFLDLNLDFVGSEVTIPDFSFGPAIRENYVIHYILSGRGCFYIDGNPYPLETGDCFILPADVETFYQSDGLDPWSYAWLGISGHVISELFERTLLSDNKWLLKQVSDTRFIKHFRRIQALAYEDSPYMDVAIQSELYALMQALIIDFPALSTKRQSQSDYYAEKAYIFINNHFNRGIKIKDVLDHVMVSRAYLFTIFKKKYGLSPKKYLIDLRMDHAARLLVHSENMISQISEATGFSDSLSFSTAFKKRYGVSPTKFRAVNHDKLVLKTMNTLNRIKK